VSTRREERLARTRASLEGLSLGDALGEYFFGPQDMVVLRIGERMLLKPPWHYTDDTQMALSIVSILRKSGAGILTWVSALTATPGSSLISSAK
jgi:ADP-ribosylglycohydrolase